MEDRDVVSVVVVAVVLWVLVSCGVVTDSWFSSSTCVSPPCSQNAIVACYFLFTVSFRQRGMQEWPQSRIVRQEEKERAARVKEIR